MPDQEPESDRSYSRFKALMDAYEREPTLENYVRFRRTFGVSGTDVARFTEFDSFAIEAELRSFRIDPWLVNGALDGDERQMDELTLRLMEALIEREKIERNGGSHLQSRRIAISDSLVDFVIVAMMEAAESHDSPIPSSLIALVRERLCGTAPDRYKEFLRMQRRRDAIALAAIKFPTGSVSIRRLAALIEVEPSTISRWFRDGDFKRHVDSFRRSIDALGLRKKHTDG
jgi:hypothetical protein